MKWLPRHRAKAAALRSAPLPCGVLPTAADLAAEADGLAERLVASGAVDGFNAHVADELFDEKLHDAEVALTIAIDEQAEHDDRIVDQGRAEWLTCRSTSLMLGAEVERLERLRDHHFTKLTGLAARPELLTVDDDHHAAADDE